MTAKTSRAEKLLDTLAVRTGMTEGGKNWLIAAIDPFHDTNFQVTGYPDSTGGASIVQVIKQTGQVSSVTGSAYDCVIRFDPFVSSLTEVNSLMTGNILTPSGASNAGYVCGGVTAMTGPVGANLAVVPFPFVAATGTSPLNLVIPTSFIRRRFRVIGVGFEAHNITAELNKQGAVTVFAQQQSRDPFTVLNTNAAATAISDSYSANWLQLSPTSAANAMLLQGSKTWDASQGAYVVCTQNNMDNPPCMASWINPIGVSNIDAAYPAVTGATVYVTNSGQASGSFNSPLMNMVLPYNSKGMYFTNLSPTTVIQVNVNYIIERFPSEIDGDLTVLATPSCEYDPIAIEAYARIIRIMPVGVPVGENGFGDWFFGEVSSLIDCLTGTNFAGGINKSLSRWADRPRNPPGNSWVNEERDVQIVRRKPRQQQPQAQAQPKKKKKKPKQPEPYSSFNQPKPKAKRTTRIGKVPT